MRTLVTGIDGFVGGYLASELSAYGHQVFGTRTGRENGNVRHMDLLDTETVRTVLADVRPEHIFHLAGFTSVKESWSHPDEALRINRDGTRNLYQTLQQLKLTPRVLITSSAEVYGIPKSLPVSETHPTAPKNPYAESKLAQERVSKDFPDIPTIVTRSFPHIGPGQSPAFVTSDFARQIVQVEHNQAAAVQVGNLEAERDFTDVRDVVVAYRLLVEKGKPNEIYNVCSGQGYRIQDILNKLLTMSSRPNIPVVKDPQRIRPVDIPILIGDHTKLTAATQWIPHIQLADTLRSIYQSYATPLNHRSGTHA